MTDLYELKNSTTQEKRVELLTRIDVNFNALLINENISIEKANL